MEIYLDQKELIGEVAIVYGYLGRVKGDLA